MRGNVSVIQNIGTSVAQLFSLQKMFVLAELYDVLHAQTPWEHATQTAFDAVLPFAGGLHGLALLLTHSHFLGLQDLKEAHRRRQALLQEFGKIFHDPRAFFSSLGTSMKADYRSRWNRLTQLMAEPSLPHQFEAGVIFGGLLLDVVLLLLTVVDGVGIALKLAKEVSELLRVVQALARVDRAGLWSVAAEPLKGLPRPCVRRKARQFQSQPSQKTEMLLAIGSTNPNRRVE